ncbi:DUF4296 domain-containing protein [Aquimarina rhabdastrellae]
MMKRVILGLGILAISCQSIEKINKPENLIPEDKMVAVLTDLAIARTAKAVNKKVFTEKEIHPVDLVYKKHGIDSVTFIKSNEWYASRLEEYDKLFERVKDTIKKSKELYAKIVKREDSIKKIQDSIAKLKKKDEKIERKLDKKAIERKLKIDTEIDAAKKKRGAITPVKKE